MKFHSRNSLNCRPVYYQSALFTYVRELAVKRIIIRRMAARASFESPAPISSDIIKGELYSALGPTVMYIYTKCY